MPAYDFQNRLRHASNRFNQINSEYIRYYRGAEVLEFIATRILHSASQMYSGPGVTRIEIQDWAFDVSNLSGFDDGYMHPLDSDYIIRENGDVFKTISISTDEPPWEYVTSTRDRVLLHTVRQTDSLLPPP